jgi:translocation and assembly module TamB
MAENAKVRITRFPWWFWAVMAGLFFVLVVALGWFLQSPAFKDIVRQRVIAELEKATGGTVQIGSLNWNVSKLEVEGKNITIRGLEPASDLPLAHADRLYARVHIISFFEGAIDLRQLTLEAPVIHVIVKPDGSTNVPEPKVKSNGDPMQQLFDLAIGKAEVHNGAILLNDQKIPLDFKAYDLALVMAYQMLAKRYDGTVQVGKMDAQFADLRDIPATGTAEFSLWRNRAQVKSLTLTSQKSSLELSGTLDDFNRPKAQLTYSGTFDLAQAGDIARIRELRGGGVNVTGSGTFSAENLAASGKVVLRNLDYIQPSLSIRNVSAGAEYALDQEHIQLKKIDARLMGGRITGSAEVKHYAPALEVSNAQVSTEKTRTSKPRGGGNELGNDRVLAVQQGSANLKVAGASLAELMQVLSTKSMPLEKLKAVGSVNGTLDLSWRQSIQRVLVEMALDAQPPAQPRADELPTSGTLRGRYDAYSGNTEIAALNLATPHTEINASGALGSRTVQLHVAANTNSLQEFQPLLSAMGSSPIPVEINGRASFNGTIAGRLKDPDIAGRLLATNFDYVYTPPAPATPPPPRTSIVRSMLHLPEPAPTPPPPPVVRRIHLDSVAADVQYGHDLLAVHNGVLQQGAAQLNIGGNVHFQQGTFTDNSPFDLDVSLRNSNLADLQKTAGTDYPVAGVVNVDLHATGTKADPQGKGNASITGAQAYGYTFKTLKSDIVLTNHETQLHNIRLEGLGGSMTGDAAYNLQNAQIRADLHAEKIDLAQIQQLQNLPVQEHGIASFSIKASGPLRKPAVDAHVEVVDLALNDEFQGALTFDAVTRGDKLLLTGRSKFERASLAFDGSIDETGDLQSDMHLQFSQLDIDPFLTAELRTHITGHSSLNGRASLRGPLRQPRALTGSATVDAFSVELEHLAIQSDGPTEVELADQVLTLKRVGLRSQDTSLTAGGSIDFKGDRPLDLYARGHLNLALFHALDDEIDSYGTTEADLTVKGTMANPLMNGRVVVAHAGFSMIDLPAALGEVNGTMVFNHDRLEVEHLAGRVGGGQVTFAGYITYGKTIAFDLTTKGTDIRFRYGGVSITADQQLRLNGTLKAATLAGDVTITRFAQIPAVDVSATFAEQPPSMPNPASPLNNLRLDVHITSSPELTVQTTLAKLSGDVDLRVRGTGTRPTLLGRINIAEGDIKVNGTKYHLDRGDVTFANALHIDPILDVEATTRVRDFDITIGLHGTMEKLTTTYRSDPPLSSDDIISLLAFGQTQEERFAQSSSSSLGEGAGNVVLGQFINQMVTSRVSKLFGVSAIRINPALGGPDNNPSARLTIEQQVSNNVTLTYITNLTQSAQQVIQFEYNINSDYTVQGIRDENGVVSFDLLIRKRKK